MYHDRIEVAAPHAQPKKAEVSWSVPQTGLLTLKPCEVGVVKGGGGVGSQSRG